MACCRALSGSLRWQLSPYSSTRYTGWRTPQPFRRNYSSSSSSSITHTEAAVYVCTFCSEHLPSMMLPARSSILFLSTMCSSTASLLRGRARLPGTGRVATRSRATHKKSPTLRRRTSNSTPVEEGGRGGEGLGQSSEKWFSVPFFARSCSRIPLN